VIAENTQRKIREANFFLGHLIQYSQRFPSGRVVADNQEEFAYYLSAFLSAAYSILEVLMVEVGRDRLKEYRTWYRKWLSGRTNAERRLLPPARSRGGRDRKSSEGFIADQRHAEVHNKGAKARAAWTMIPITRLRQNVQHHPAHMFFWPGPSDADPPRVGLNVYYFDIDDHEAEAVQVCTQHLELLKALVDDFVAEHP
jgi:hypothetical protein